ncbi:MAG: hypothetical protein WDN28_07275 [Chthoniobacter sp.]
MSAGLGFGSVSGGVGDGVPLGGAASPMATVALIATKARAFETDE